MHLRTKESYLQLKKKHSTLQTASLRLKKMLQKLNLSQRQRQYYYYYYYHQTASLQKLFR